MGAPGILAPMAEREDRAPAAETRGQPRSQLGLVLAAGLALLVVLGGVPAVLDAVDEPPECPDATVVFARGSGQEPGATEAEVLFAAVAERRSDLAIELVELGADGGHGGFAYPAAGGRRAMLGARVGSGSGERYFASVEEGRAEAVAAVAEQLDECPDQRLVLAGYSQGAQVIGEALFDLPADDLDRVAFVALFGDPKLLTNGQGALPPACMGNQKPWRRGNLRCYHDGGVLGPRDPYVPDAISERVGSWCDKQDGVCTGNESFLFDDAHAEYPLAEIPSAADEIAGVLAEISG